MIGLSVAMLAGFSKSGNIVTDSVTGLQWQDNSDNNDSNKRVTWTGAISYCEQIEIDGHDDWRLPNINELESITDLSRSAPAIDPTFQHTASDGYWSSTTIVGHEGNAWGVYFHDGGDDWDDKDGTTYVRCVRARQ
jgi:hypothetical protein